MEVPKEDSSHTQPNTTNATAVTTTNEPNATEDSHTVDFQVAWDQFEAYLKRHSKRIEALTESQVQRISKRIGLKSTLQYQVTNKWILATCPVAM